jgi:7-keto-8-aminopelargonate synthetase-like enzyme
LIESEEGAKRQERLWSRVDQFRSELSASAPHVRDLPRSAIIPWIVGGESDALNLSVRVQQGGLFIPAIRYPSVGRGKARLRITITAAHSAEDIRMLTTEMKALVTPQEK